MNPGEVVWVHFPGGAGRAQSGRRPALVVQGAKATARLPTVVVIPLTTQQDALRFPGTLLIEPEADNGLRKPSVALGFQILRDNSLHSLHAAVDRAMNATNP